MNRTVREAVYLEIGEARGVKLGEKKGTDRVNQLNRVLLEEKRMEDLERAVRAYPIFKREKDNPRNVML